MTTQRQRDEAATHGANAGMLTREDSGAPGDDFVSAFIDALKAHRFYDRAVEPVAG